MGYSRRNDLAVIILAAGEGKRMKAGGAKVLAELRGRPLLSYVIETSKKLSPAHLTVVVGHEKEKVMKRFQDEDVTFVIQAEQLGTGHAVSMAKEVLDSFTGTLIVLYGDVPLVSEKTIRNLFNHHCITSSSVTLLTAVVDNPYGYGRIVRSEEGRLLKIVEEKDAALEEKKISEVNTAVGCFELPDLWRILTMLKNDNKQGEYYLTDTVEIYIKEGARVEAVQAENPVEILGVNTSEDLANLERLL